MTPFICRECKQETWKIYGLGCPKCHKVDQRVSSFLHEKAGIKDAPKMTKARQMHYRTRKIRSDGAIRADIKWR